MIVLYTDYGHNDPYTGLLKAVIQERVSHIPVIDLMADAPAFNIKASAYLLAALARQFSSDTIFVAVVDPGVGGVRLPVVVEADGQKFVGPLNGLFDVIIHRASKVTVQVIDDTPFELSASFHGRDIFAPVGVMLALNEPVSYARVVEEGILHPDWTADVYEIIYIDHFGNAYTGIQASQLDLDSVLEVSGQQISYGCTFSDVQMGEAFWYGNSLGQVEIALRQGSAEKVLGLEIGTKISVVMAN